MCTVAAINMKGFFIIKTRDPIRGKAFDDGVELFLDTPKKFIIRNQDGMYGGINENGVGVAAANVIVKESQIAFYNNGYVRELLESKTAQESLQILRNFDPPIGGNVIIADEHECFAIECGPEDMDVKNVTIKLVLTNHFHYLPYEPLNFKDPFIKKWSNMRYQRACDLLQYAERFEDLISILSDHQSFPEFSICNHGIIQTSSAFIIDTKGKKIHYCHGHPCNNPFIAYSFSTI